MNVYFTTIGVEPKKDNPQFSLCSGAQAHLWIMERNEEKAMQKAMHHLATHKWKITGVEIAPVATTLEQFDGRDIGQQSYLEAKRYGVSLKIVGWSRDGQTAAVVKF